MTTPIKPIKLWGKGGMNPPKIVLILRELDLPYEEINVPMKEVKNEDYVAINPNGRLPSIHDPNTGITLWESGAIVEYLVERYDKEQKVSFPPGTAEAYHAKQWLYFQVSGQGPYYGQAAWFTMFHPTKIPDAIDRYVNEVNRLSGVLDKYLAQKKEEAGDGDSDGPWLVGSKYCYADGAFICWQKGMEMMLQKEQYDVDNYPHVKDWLNRMSSREAVAFMLQHALRKAD